MEAKAPPNGIGVSCMAAAEAALPEVEEGAFLPAATEGKEKEPSEEAEAAAAVEEVKEEGPAAPEEEEEDMRLTTPAAVTSRTVPEGLA